MALRVKGLRSTGISNTTTPDSYIRQATDEELLSQIELHDSTSVKYTEWQRLELERKGRKTKRMQVVQVERSKQEFLDIMRKEIPDFRSHCLRVKIQYEEVNRLKYPKVPFCVLLKSLFCMERHAVYLSCLKKILIRSKVYMIAN